MRWHWVVAAVLLGGVVWWTASQSGGDSDGETDPRALRDEIAASPAVVATFVAAGGTEVTFTFTLVRGEGWVWDWPGDRNVSNVLVPNQREHLLELRSGCSIATDGADEPLIPGLNVAERLVGIFPQERRDPTTFAYVIEFGESRSLSVIEDLPDVASGSFRAKTVGLPPRALIGDFTVRAAAEDEARAARKRIAETRASDVSRVEFMLRYVVAGGNNRVVHQNAVVAAACPDLPVVLTGPLGIGGCCRPWAQLSEFILAAESSPWAVEGIPLDLPITAPEPDLFAAAQGGRPDRMRIRVGEPFLVPFSDRPAFIAYEVTACEPKPWFAC